MVDINKLKKEKRKKQKQVTYNINSEILEKFNEFAKANNLNKSLLIQILIEELLKKYKVIKG